MVRSSVSDSPFRLQLASGPAGTGIIALEDIVAESEVLFFDGEVLPWAKVPPDEIIYVMMSDSGDWVVPRTIARFVNHSCEPNLRFDARRMLIATRAIRAGEALSCSYNVLEPFEEERRRSHPDWYFWDARWSFDCLCQSAACQGRIDGYAVRGTAP